jgi:hypothetical protein
MKKVIAAAVVAVLVIGSSAIGQIEQGQTWTLGLLNNMALSGGPSLANTIQGVGTLNVQALGINPDLAGNPTVIGAGGVGAALFQTGTVATGGAAAGLVQGLGIVGTQEQAIGDLAGPVQEVQTSELDGTQVLTKGIGSNAAISGLNLAGFGMAQLFENNCAEGGQLSLVLGGQFSSVEGAAQAVAVVGTEMIVSVGQVQNANVPQP